MHVYGVQCTTHYNINHKKIRKQERASKKKVTTTKIAYDKAFAWIYMSAEAN